MLAPLGAFQPFLLGMRMPFDPACFVGSTQFSSHMGQGLGQADVHVKSMVGWMYKPWAGGKHIVPISGKILFR